MAKDFDDFSELCTQTLSDEGVWKQVEVRGELWNVDVKFLGDDAEVVQKFAREKLRAKMKHVKINGNSASLDDETVDDVIKDEDENAFIRFVGIRKHDTKKPIKWQGNEIPVEKTKESEKYYRAILKGSPDIRDFFMQETKYRSNFFPTGKKN